MDQITVHQILLLLLKFLLYFTLVCRIDTMTIFFSMWQVTL